MSPGYMWINPDGFAIELKCACHVDEDGERLLCAECTDKACTEEGLS
jgi:hypothetical protein